MTFFRLVSLLFGVLLAAGCANVSSKIDPNVDLTKFKKIYVYTASNDSNHIDALIAGELRKLGYEATSGVRTMMPEDAELFLTYDGQWTWDFRLYLIQLNLQVREVGSQKLVGSGSIFRPGVTPKAPDAMAREVLEPMFRPKKK